MTALFFLHPGDNSRSIFLDIAAGFRKAGCETVSCELGQFWQARAAAAQAGPALHDQAIRALTDQIAGFMRAQRVDLSIGMWANAITTLAPHSRDGRVINFFERIERPHVMYWLDAPHWAHQGGLKNLLPSPLFNNPWLHHVINNRATAREMTGVLGFGHVTALPYGVNEEVFRPRHAEAQQEFDIVFGLGPGDEPPTDVMRRELEHGEDRGPDEQAIRLDQARVVRAKAPRFIDRFDPALRDPAADLFERLVESQLESPGTPSLQRVELIARERASLRRACEALRAAPALFIDLTAALRAIDNWRRAFIISLLARHFRCAVFGSAGLEGWNCPATRLGCLPYADQPLAYARGRIGLNVMRWQDDVGLNIKPFEITASGTCCLMAQRPGIDECFDIGREIVTFSTPIDALRKTRALLDDPEQREAIARAGRARTLRDHTWTKRAAALLDCVMQPGEESHPHSHPQPEQRHAIA